MRKQTRWTLLGAGLTAAAGLAGYFKLRGCAVERPDYRVREKDGAAEVRDYPELLVVETTETGAREPSLRTGFRRLADYIFAKDRDGRKIPMTVPVLSDNAIDSRRWRTRFVMPARFRRETLPDPTPEVEIAVVPARRVGVIRFKGKATDAVLRDKERELRDWLAMHGHDPMGTAEHAYYDPPMKPARLRRTEVILPLRR
ncbi:SOUL family heme-binding protein [Stakelama saccharophila]|uniref:Heme-binding protein n=1 Tax=Stakelama saccharophila TaxID=3075605 RepID=A0ABZ0B705_9SPHN|nr:heme-binding protein [Stakelama sp. W311]WNO52780.1 heme-binding protein [Stakelama sp. W311]